MNEAFRTELHKVMMESRIAIHYARLATKAEGEYKVPVEYLGVKDGLIHLRTVSIPCDDVVKVRLFTRDGIHVIDLQNIPVLKKGDELNITFQLG